MKRFNINYNISFRLDTDGADCMNAYFKRLNGNKEPVKIYIAGDIVNLQMWEAMMIFGPAMTYTCDCPIYHCGIYIDDKCLEDVESIESAEKRDWDYNFGEKDSDKETNVMSSNMISVNEDYFNCLDKKLKRLEKENAELTEINKEILKLYEETAPYIPSYPVIKYLWERIQKCNSEDKK